MQRKDDIIFLGMQLSFLVYEVAEPSCFWGEQLGAGSGLPQERGCYHAQRTHAALVTITTLLVHQPLNTSLQVAGKECYQDDGKIRADDRGVGLH